MFQRFYPDTSAKSAYEIPYENLYQKGYRGVIFDIDNTLVPHDAPADERAVALFQRLREIGYQTCLLSNNGEGRVRAFGERVQTQYICNAGKPGRKKYLEAIRKMGLELSEIFFVGDQLFTDIWGAKRTGIYSVLVRPVHPKEKLQIRLKRKPEKVVLYFYRRAKGNRK